MTLRLAVSATIIATLAGLANAAPAPTANPTTRTSINLPSATATELRAAFDAATKANQAFQLAQKEWESKYNAWLAAEYKARYDLSVPRDFVLNLETGAFEPRQAPASMTPAAPGDGKKEKNKQ